MSARWDAAEAPILPEPGWGGWLLLILRAPLALLATALFFMVFLLLRGFDILMRRSRVPALAPFVVTGWAWVALGLMGLRVRCEGRMMVEPGALVANHASWLDIVTLQRAGRVFFVSKSEVSGWPVIGFIGRAIGTVFIERRAVEARRQTEILRDRLRRGDRLCIFPEGTSSDGQRVLPFKSSLFGVFFEPDLRAHLWVQPVSIAYRPRAGLPAEFYGWWGGMDFGAHLLSVLKLSRGGVVTLRFHPPARAADFADRKLLAARAGADVAEGFAALRG